MDISIRFEREEIDGSSCNSRGLFEGLAFGYPQSRLGDRTSEVVNLNTVELGDIDLDEEDPVPDPDPALDETGQ